MKSSLLAKSMAAALLAIATVSAMAADPEIPERGPIPFESMDADGNGYLSPEEFGKAHARRMQQRSESGGRHQYRHMHEHPEHADVDTDQDGRISREELQAHRQQRMQQHAQERAERRQQHDTRHQEMMERHHERAEEMRQKRSE